VFVGKLILSRDLLPDVLINVVEAQTISLLHMEFHLTCSTASWSYEQCRIRRKKCNRFAVSWPSHVLDHINRTEHFM